MSFYSDVCGAHEEYRQIYFPSASSWSAWKMRLRKLHLPNTPRRRPRKINLTILFMYTANIWVEMIELSEGVCPCVGIAVVVGLS